jgi:hexosaminidase
VIDEIDRMYTDADLELTVFHIGGDEVPRGAWTGSAVSRAFMDSHGMKNVRELKNYFLEQLLPLLAERHIRPAGWEEVAMHEGAPNPKFASSDILSYCWNTLPDWKGDQLPYKLANAGYPVVLCNVSNFYMDMAYSSHPLERGLHWGGFVDEYNSFDMLPYDIYRSVRHTLRGVPIDLAAAADGKVPLNRGAAEQIQGLQAQLWAETIRSFDQIERLCFPKIFGLVERAWNTQPAWADPYNEGAYLAAKREYTARIVRFELMRLARARVNFHIAQPGLLVRDGLLYANSALPEAEIRYTTDGSEPLANSLLWTEPVACTAPLVLAKVFYLGKESVATRLE